MALRPDDITESDLVITFTRRTWDADGNFADDTEAHAISEGETVADLAKRLLFNHNPSWQTSDPDYTRSLELRLVRKPQPRPEPYRSEPAPWEDQPAG